MKKALCCLLLSCSLNALHYSPWLPEPFIPQVEAGYGYFHSDKVNLSGKTTDAKLFAHRASLGAGMGIWYESSYDLQLQVNAAGTGSNTFGFEDVTLLARSELANGITAASMATVSVGVQLSYVRDKYRKDPALFHHGRWELFPHIAIGKEIPCGEHWGQRAWGFVGLGTADRGSLWAHSKISLEQNHHDCYFYGLTAENIVGFGRNPLDLTGFIGYGAIAHRSLDLGAFFQKNIGFASWAKLAYSYRAWAHNFPAATHHLQATLYYAW